MTSLRTALDSFVGWWLQQNHWRYLWVPVAVAVAMTEAIVCAMTLLLLGRIDGNYLLVGLVCSSLVSLTVSAFLFLLSDRGRRSMEAEMRQRASLKRLNEVAALAGLPLQEQLRQALAVGTSHFGLDFGIVSHVAGDIYRVVAQVSPPATLHDNQEFPLGVTYCSITLAGGGVVAIPAMGRSPHHGHPCYQEFALEAYIGAAIELEGKIFGTVNFSSPRPYLRSFDEGDREFLLLLARWIGSAIERDRRQQALAASEEKLRSLYELSPLGIALTDMQGRYLEFNEAFRLICGYPADELRTLDYWALTPKEYAAAEARQLEALERTGRYGPYEKEYLRKDGSRVPLQLTGARVTGRDGSRHIWSIVEDISPRRRGEADLRAAKEAAEAASRAKSEFLANMSHEIRTPLNGVIGMAQLLQQTDLTPEQGEYARTISVSAEALLAVINDVLDFSKVEAGKLAVEHIAFRPEAVIREVTDLFGPLAAARRLSFNLAVAGDLPEWVSGDPHRLRQILNNLIGNAIKFTLAGEVAVGLALEGSAGGVARLRFSIRDTGIGMAPETIGRLFAPFYQADASTTRRYGGTGLGLSISHRLVKLMGGTIGVESAPGSGSAFVVSIPFPLAAAPDTGTPVAEPAVGNHLHALVVDDGEINQAVARHMLARLGVRATVAGNGAEAIELLRRHPCDIVLMDCQMPTVDGYEATRRIRAGEAGAGAAGVRIVAMTAHAMPGDREKCLAAGMDDHLVKPLTLDALRNKLAEWLPGAGGA